MAVRRVSSTLRSTQSKKNSVQHQRNRKRKGNTSTSASTTSNLLQWVRMVFLWTYCAESRYFGVYNIFRFAEERWFVGEFDAGGVTSKFVSLNV